MDLRQGLLSQLRRCGSARWLVHPNQHLSNGAAAGSRIARPDSPGSGLARVVRRRWRHIRRRHQCLPIAAVANVRTEVRILAWHALPVPGAAAAAVTAPAAAVTAAATPGGAGWVRVVVAVAAPSRRGGGGVG